MKWWFQRKKSESRPALEAGSASKLGTGQSHVETGGLRTPMPSEEQLVMIRRHWEQFEGSRDAIPGIVQHSAHGYEAIAATIGMILGDSTVHFAVYSDTPAKPNTVLVRGQSTGDVPASLRKDGVVFNYRGFVYYTSADYSVMKTLEVLDYFWPNEAFTFVYGVYATSPLMTRREYYLSGPKSIPKGKNAFLVSTSRQSGPDPSTIEIELLWDNGEVYTTRLQNGITKLELTRVKKEKEQKQPEPPRINAYRSSIEKDVQDGHMQAAISAGSTLVTHVSADAIHSPTLPSELPYVGRNLDALQKRIAMVLDALDLIGDRTICVKDYARVRDNLNRLQDEAKIQGGKVTRLAGSRELSIASGNPLSGTPYPLMAILPAALPLPENSKDIMFWVPGCKQFYRVIAYHFENGFADGRIFDGNTCILDERLLDGTDLRYCVVDEWGHASLLPRDPVTALFVPSLRSAIHPAYKGPLIAGNPIDSDSWKWVGQVQGRDIVFLGNVV